MATVSVFNAIVKNGKIAPLDKRVKLTENEKIRVQIVKSKPVLKKKRPQPTSWAEIEQMLGPARKALSKLPPMNWDAEIDIDREDRV